MVFGSVSYLPPIITQHPRDMRCSNRCRMHFQVFSKLPEVVTTDTDLQHAMPKLRCAAALSVHATVAMARVHGMMRYAGILQAGKHMLSQIPGSQREAQRFPPDLGRWFEFTMALRGLCNQAGLTGSHSRVQRHERACKQVPIRPAEVKHSSDRQVTAQDTRGVIATRDR